MEPWMIERLEQLRREQNPATERPALQLPLHRPQPYPPRPVDETTPSTDVDHVVDLTL